MQMLDILFPIPRRITIGGAAHDILPLPLSRCAGFAAAMTPVMPVLLAGQLQAAATDHYDDLRTALVIATGIDPAVIDALLPDAFIALLAVVLEVNADFFHGRVLPQAARLMAVLHGAPAAVTEAAGQTGPTPPSGSDGPDTTLPPSDG